MIIKKAQTSGLRGLAQLFNEYRVFYRKESDIEQALSF